MLRDPIKKVPFTLEHVVPDRKANSQIKALIEMIKSERKMSRLQPDTLDLIHDKDIDKTPLQPVFRSS